MKTDWKRIYYKKPGSDNILSLPQLMMSMGGAQEPSGTKPPSTVALGLLTKLLDQMDGCANTCLNANCLYLMKKNNDVVIMNDKAIDTDKYIYLSFTTCSFEFMKLAFIESIFKDNYLVVDHTLDTGDYPLNYDYYAVAHLMIGLINPESQMIFPNAYEIVESVYETIHKENQLIFIGFDEKHKGIAQFYNKLLIYHMVLTSVVAGAPALGALYDDIGNLSKSSNVIRRKFNVYYQEIVKLDSMELTQSFEQSLSSLDENIRKKIKSLLQILLIYNPIFRPGTHIIKKILSG
jgi:hypothetical protein